MFQVQLVVFDWQIYKSQLLMFLRDLWALVNLDEEGFKFFEALLQL